MSLRLDRRQDEPKFPFLAPEVRLTGEAEAARLEHLLIELRLKVDGATAELEESRQREKAAAAAKSPAKAAAGSAAAADGAAGPPELSINERIVREMPLFEVPAELQHYTGRNMRGRRGESLSRPPAMLRCAAASGHRRAAFPTHAMANGACAGGRGGLGIDQLPLRVLTCRPRALSR